MAAQRQRHRRGDQQHSRGDNVPISYTITNAQPFDSGDYQVVVANAVASEESPCLLRGGELGRASHDQRQFQQQPGLCPLTNGGGAGHQ